MSTIPAASKTLRLSLVLIVLCMVLALPKTGKAATQPRLFFGPITSIGSDEYTVDVQADTAGNKIGGIEAWVVLPTGSHFVSANATKSDLPLEATAATASGQSVHMVRLILNTKDGLSGSNLEVEQLTIYASGGTPTISFNTALDKMISYSSSTDLLHQPKVAATVTPSPAATQSNTVPYIAMGVLILVLLGLLVGLTMMKKSDAPTVK